MLSSESSAARRPHLGFVTWDGPDQDYLRSLFLPWLGGLVRAGWPVSIAQFTWADAERRAEIAACAREHGVDYEAFDVVRRPPSLSIPASLLVGGARLVPWIRRRGVEVLIPRAILPAGMALLARRALSYRGQAIGLVFEADGLMADERVDFAGWAPDGARYRVLRRIEATAVRAATVTVCRSSHAREILLARTQVPASRVVAIPNGKDPRVFHPGDAAHRAATRAAWGVPAHAPLLIYAGTLGAQYVPDRMLRLLQLALTRQPETRLIVLTGQPHVMEALLATAAPEVVAATQVRRVAPHEVPAVLASADLGLALRTPTFSQQAVCPIKVAEYLLCGLPTVSTRGIGDLDDRLARDGSDGVLVVGDHQDAALRHIVTWWFDEVLPGRDSLRSAAREAGMRHFSLDAVVGAWRSLLEASLGQGRA